MMMPGVRAVLEITIRSVPSGSRTLIRCTSISVKRAVCGAVAGLWPATAPLASDAAQAIVSTPE